MGLGYLKIQVHVANDALPIPNALIEIYEQENLIYKTETDNNGNTNIFSLQTPNKVLTLIPTYDKPAYSVYNVNIECEGYVTKHIQNVPIVDTQTTILIENMQPLLDEKQPETDEYIDIAPVNLLASYEIKQANVYTNRNIDKLHKAMSYSENLFEQELYKKIFSLEKRGVYIPEQIVIHLGTPTNSDALNLNIRFIDYIKNVASSEIYSTWPPASLEANINVIVTFALNRIYTEWYRSRGFNFDITNDITYDMSYRYGGPVFENISAIVDNFFNVYASRRGLKNPFFTQFCNGVTVKCNGLSQWGTVTLANQGKAPIDILRYYYTEELDLEITDDLESIIVLYPGYPLSLGSQGDPVKLMQNYLNSISNNYPLILKISNPDGTFNEDTTEAVEAFQNTFNIESTGTINEPTWNMITYIFVSIARLSELYNEAPRVPVSETPRNVTLSIGSRDPEVLEVQYIISYIALFYPTVSSARQDGVYGSNTRNAVIEFQKTFGLYPDGVVGVATWNKLYAVYNGIQKNVQIPTTPLLPGSQSPEYPGSPLILGSTGANVITMQSYLNAIGAMYPVIPYLVVDGILGVKTKGAITIFQKLNHIEPTGDIDLETWNKIAEAYALIASFQSISLNYPGTELAIGSEGDDVKLMQKFLSDIRMSYPTIPNVVVNGVYEPNTENAVKAFQRLFGIDPTGIIDENTWYAIIEKTNEIV